MKIEEIKALWKEHGGGFHGPIVEQAHCEQQAFYRFCDALSSAAQQRGMERAANIVRQHGARTLQGAKDMKEFFGAISDTGALVAANRFADAEMLADAIFPTIPRGVIANDLAHSR